MISVMFLYGTQMTQILCSADETMIFLEWKCLWNADDAGTS